MEKIDFHTTSKERNGVLLDVVSTKIQIRNPHPMNEKWLTVRYTSYVRLLLLYPLLELEKGFIFFKTQREYRNWAFIIPSSIDSHWVIQEWKSMQLRHRLLLSLATHILPSIVPFQISLNDWLKKNF